jgi:aminopeptidase YwaD
MRLQRLVMAAALCAAALGADDIRPQRYKETVRVLASDEMRGRGTGSPELERAARYLATQFEKIGIPPADGKSYYQRFPVTTNATMGPKNLLSWTDGTARHTLQLKADFVPFNFSGNADIQAPAVFAGYGITAPEYNYDDYAGIDVKDKIVVLLRHEPQEFDEKSVFSGKAYTRHADKEAKAVNARFHGARAVLYVNDVMNHTDPDDLDPFTRVVGPGFTAIPFVQMKLQAAQTLVGTAGVDLKQWVSEVDKDLKPRPAALPASVQVSLSTDVEREQKEVPNLCAYLRGTTDEYIVIGAHFDHLGMGEYGSMAPSLAGKEIHHGADDNASGTAGVLELAHYFKDQPQPKRGILFLAFSGEELGLLGSSWYVNHPILPLDKAVAMINMDMIGRIRDHKVFVGGSGTGSTFQQLLRGEEGKTDLKLDLSEQGGYGSSDHMSFTTKQVPVLFFFSGLHGDYHKPSDTWDKIDAAAAADLLRLVASIAGDLAGAPERPQFVRTTLQAPQAMASASARPGYGPYFGSVPDMSDVPGGCPLSDVREGSPAAQAGLTGGDVIFEFGGQPVHNLMEFTYALRSHKPGDEVTVKWRRGSKVMEGKTVLTTRK